MFWVKVSYLVALVLVTPIHYTQVMGKSRVCSKGPPERIGTWKLTSVAFTILQMFAGIYRDFAGKSECGDFKFTGIACIPAIPVIFEVNQKKCGLFVCPLY